LIIPFLDKNRVVWECACGDHAITKVLQEAGFSVVESDIKFAPEQDFLSHVKDLASPYQIVTNPPFSRKKQFYERCLELDVPFALLIPADYSGWMIQAVDFYGCIKIIPTRRIDYITPSGKDASVGATADFHSLWLTRGLNYPQIVDPGWDNTTEIFVDLSLEDKKRIY
jgi:hypothetical protein